jgi:dTDP-4-dehydrorhamnose reductase
MRVAVIGANGQLGTDACEAFRAGGHEVVPLTHAEVEVADPASVSGALLRAAPECVVNTAAMHHVERCEQDPGAALAVNALGARNLALAARDRGFALLHVSTDYVFGGERTTPYTERDCPAPLNAYGVSKLAGEHFVRALAPRHAVVRSGALFGRAPCRAKDGPNFVRRMLGLAREAGEVTVVADEVVTPTYTLDLARQLVVIAEAGCCGVVHATADGHCSWYEFAAAIFELARVPARLRAAEPGAFPARARRPAYSVLANERLAREGLDVMPGWRSGLSRYLREIGELAEAGHARTEDRVNR